MLTLLEENLGYLPKNKTCLSNLGNRIGAVAQDVERLPTKPRPGVQSPGPQIHTHTHTRNNDMMFQTLNRLGG